jgi:phosphohistidine swiveling domain-containing protein
MLPHMVITPKHWFQDTESHSSHLEHLLHVAMAQSLPLSPFLVITHEAFEAFAAQNKLNSLERELTFPLNQTEQKKLIQRCKRLTLPEPLMNKLASLYPSHIGKHEVIAWGVFPGDAPKNLFDSFVGEVSALAQIRLLWAEMIARQGVTKTRSLLRTHPIFLLAQPKHTFTGMLALQDKQLVTCTIQETSKSSARELRVYINLSTGEIVSRDEGSEQVNPPRLPLSAPKLYSVARGLYRKSLYKGMCPLAGNKLEVWVQPQPEMPIPPNETPKSLPASSPILAKGQSKGKGIAVGQVILVTHERDWRKVRSHHIVVTNLNPKKAHGISLAMRALVAERPSLAVLVSGHLRELRFPVVTGVAHATKLFANGQVISVDASKATIYAGNRFATNQIVPVYPTLGASKQPVTTRKTHITKRKLQRILFVKNPRIIGDAQEDLRAYKRVLLSWGATILSEIGVHPQRLIKDRQSGKIIEFISNSLSTFARECPTTSLMYALSNVDPAFLARLTFSPTPKQTQKNPFGLRGVAKLLVDESDFVHLELTALAKAHAKRVHLEIVAPFVRTPQELIAFKRLLASFHLIRGGYVKLFMRVETPAQLDQIEAFIDAGIDGLVLDMHRLSLLYSGISTVSADHAPLKNHVYEELVAFINHQCMGLPSNLPVYAWFHDYDVAFNSDMYPKLAKAFIA